MDMIIAKIGSEQSVELVQHRSGRKVSIGHMTPQDGAYLARAMLACASASCGSDPPRVGTIVADECVPVMSWAVRPFEGRLLLTLKIRPGIDLSFRMPL